MTDPVVNENDPPIEPIEPAAPVLSPIEQMAEDRKRRQAQLDAVMPPQHITDRVRAAHPFAADSDAGLQAALDDLERLTKAAENPSPVMTTNG